MQQVVAHGLLPGKKMPQEAEPVGAGWLLNLDVSLQGYAEPLTRQKLSSCTIASIAAGILVALSSL